MSAEPGATIRVRWAGLVVSAEVVRRYKNGNLVVDLHGQTTWTGGRNGHRTRAPRVRVEPWQVITDGSPLTEGRLP